MTSLLDALKQQLGPDTIQQISTKLGADPATTSKAISVALPVILGGLSRNASNPGGANSLNTALGAHDGSILDNLGGLFSNPAAAAGTAILGHILGSRQAPVEQGVTKATGMNAQQVTQLLMMLAPIVMGVLGRMKQQQGLGPQQIPDVINQGRAEIEKQAPGTSVLGSILDSNHDGQIVDDVARIGSSILGGLFSHRA